MKARDTEKAMRSDKQNRQIKGVLTWRGVGAAALVVSGVLRPLKIIRPRGSP